MKIKNITEIRLLTTKVKDKNMSFRVGKEGALVNRKKFLEFSKLRIDRQIFLLLQYGDKVIRVGEKDLGKGARDDKSALKADALITNTKEAYLSILTADCLPIAVYDFRNKAIGLIHASRHNISKIIVNTIKKMIKDFNTDSKGLLVNIGSSIGPCHYEMDLWRVAERDLENLKIPKNNIYNSRICTFESDEYYSYREAKTRSILDNRFVTIIGLKESI